MAEARQGTDGLTSTIRNVELQYDEYGMHFDFRLSVPRPKHAVKAVKRQAGRFARWVVTLMYPRGLTVTAFFSVAIALLVLNADPESWFRTGWVAELAWNIADYLWWPDMPHTWKLAIVSLHTGFVLSLLVALLEQAFLRILLGQTEWVYLPARKTPTKWKLWGLAVQLLSGGFDPSFFLNKPLLYAYKRVLPTLPLPKLEDSVAKYLESVKALQSEKEFAATKAEAAEFLANEGPQLQWYLWLKWLTTTNYISDWWEKYVYLRGRSSIAINSNYYCIDGPMDKTPTTIQEARAAVVVWELLNYKRVQDMEALLPIKARGVVPLCMEQHLRMFSTVRVAGRESDSIVHYENHDSRHIVVLCKGTYYKLDVFTEKGYGKLLTPAEFEKQFRLFMDDAADEEARRNQEAEKIVLSQHSSANIAALTTMNRTKWAETRETHFAAGVNKANLHTVESAIFVMVLDDSSPTSLTERGHSLLAGKGNNRWFDKSLCVVTFANGRVGMNSEHSWADALVVAHLWERVFCAKISIDRDGGYDETGHCALMKADDKSNSSSDGDGSSKKAKRDISWRRLEWDIRHPELAETIEHAYKEAAVASSDVDLDVNIFTEFGKGLMKKMQMSPDSLIQMAMQLAFWRDQKKFCLTYEASMTRFFRHGRTETIRSLSTDSVAFVRAMEDGKASKEEIRTKLAVAVKAHGKCAKDALTGRGIDRHLFGLYVVSNGKGIESPFLKTALSGTWQLSTSQQPQMQQPKLWNPSKDKEDARCMAPGGGFGPVADDGYGVSYMIGAEDCLFFHVSSKKAAGNTDSARFRQVIHQALCDIRDLFDFEAMEASKKKADEAKKGK